MPQNSTGKVTLGDLRTKGLLDLHRQGTTWVAVIRLRDGRLTNLALEESITTRKAALQFLKAELSKLELGAVPNSSAKLLRKSSKASGKGSNHAMSRAGINGAVVSSPGAPSPDGSGRRARPWSSVRQAFVAIRYSHVRSEARAGS